MVRWQGHWSADQCKLGFSKGIGGGSVGAARARRSGASGGGVRSGDDKVEKGVSWPNTFCVRIHAVVKSILFSFFHKMDTIFLC